MNHCTAEQLIAFEKWIYDIFEVGDLPFLIHLSGGNEEQLIRIFEGVNAGDWIFSSHRNHFHYLLSGGDPGVLEQKIRNGKSMFVYGRAGEDGLECNFITSSILAGNCCIAAGVAWELKRLESKNRVWCFVGDGARENGHFAEAVAFVHGHDLPCTFIVENNLRSVDTPPNERLPRGSGIKWPDCVMEYEYQPTYPHGGTGTKTWVQFNDEIVKKFSHA